MRLKILASTLAASLLTLAGSQTRPTASPAPATPLVADGAMAIAQSVQAPMIEDWLPTPSPGCCVHKLPPGDRQAGAPLSVHLDDGQHVPG